VIPRRAAGLALAACGLLLAACATHGPLIEPTRAPVELAGTPFFPQRTHQCGPAALATVLGASGVAIEPDTLTPLVYLPGRNGSLTIEMQAAPRRYGRIVYPLDPDLDALTAELDAGRPVLVLHNYGLPFWPRWHYAVAIGYDAAKQRILLRSGTTRRQRLSAANFMRAWDNADRWALVLLKPGELPARAERTRYLEAATAFERAASAPDARLAWQAAVGAWPEEPVAWVGRGTAQYRGHDFRLAAADYRQALVLDPKLAGARNNLAQTLLDLGCPVSARRELDRIEATDLNEALRTAIADTHRQIEGAAAADAPACASLPASP
jgi:tetratricopeptide (TPR) repeat protein